VRDCHGYDGFDVPLNISSSSSAYFSIRREACSIRRVAVEPKSLSSARNSSDVGLVCAIAVIMPQGTAKMKVNTHQQRASQSKSAALLMLLTRYDPRRDILSVVNSKTRQSTLRLCD